MPPSEYIELAAEAMEYEPSTGVLTMRIVPYGAQITHKGRRISYSHVEVPTDRVIPFVNGHSDEILDRVGKLTDHEHRDDGLYGSVQLAETNAGSEFRKLAAAGLLEDVSARVLVDTTEHDEETDAEVFTGTLDHVAAVHRGAFGQSDPASRILAIHSEEREPMETPTDPATPAEHALTEADIREIVDLSGMEDEIRAMRQLIEANNEAPSSGRNIEGYEWFSAMVRHELHSDRNDLDRLIEEHALTASPGVSGGSGAAEGLVPADWWAGGLVDVRGGQRPLFNRIGRMPYPKHGTSIGFGKVVSGPDADERSAQDGDADTAALVVAEASASIQWFDGAGRIPLELIEQSDPAVMAVFFGRLMAKINAKIETYTVTTTVAGGTATTAVLTTGSTYKALITDLITTSEAIRTATDLPGNLLGCSTSDWIDILSFVDGNDRRVFAASGSAAADGSTGILSQSVDIGGITAFHVPDLSESLQFNTAAVAGTDKAPRRLQQVNVEKMGVEVGMLGSAIVAPQVTAGIQYYAAALP